MSTTGLTTQKRVLVTISAISAFILGLILSQWIFSYFQIETVTSGVLSVVSGTIIAWIVLMLSGILKEFTIKGAGLELTSKLKEVQDEVKTSNTEICGKINNLNQNFTNSIQNLNSRMDTVVTNISTNTAKAENKTTNNYYQAKGEFIEATTDTGITDSELKHDVDLSKDSKNKLDTIVTRLKTLEESLEVPVTITTKDMMRRANYNYYNQNFTKAKKIYTQILETEPDNSTALFNLAFCNAQLGQISESLLLYNKLLETEPHNSAVLNNLGNIYSKKRNNEKAKEFYNKSIKENVTDSFARVNLAHILRLENDPDGALKLLLVAEKKYPDDMAVLSGLSTTYSILKNHDKSKEYAEKGLKLTPKNRSEKIDQVIFSLVSGNPQKAVEQSQKLLDEYGDNVEDIFYNYACAKAVLNEKKEALDLLKKAIDLNPNCALTATMDPDMDNLKNDKDFQKLIGL